MSISKRAMKPEDLPKPTKEEMDLWSSGDKVPALKMYKARVGSDLIDAKTAFEYYRSRPTEEVCSGCGKKKDIGQKCWWCGQETELQLPGKPSKWAGWFKQEGDNVLSLIRAFTNKNGESQTAILDFYYNGRDIWEATFYSDSKLIFIRKGRGPDRDKFVFQVVRDADEWVKYNKRASIIHMLVSLANQLDEKGLFDEANEVDDLAKQYLLGGKGDNLKPEDVDPEQLEMGRKVEMEHTNNPEIAEEIALDHLYEFENYYDRLKEMENK